MLEDDCTKCTSSDWVVVEDEAKYCPDIGWIISKYFNWFITKYVVLAFVEPTMSSA
jgi:hypothetical protein